MSRQSRDAGPAAHEQPGAAAVSALELCEVLKRYRSGGETIRAVDRVSLRIEAGELVALYGPSGSGKTTLLMLAAALLAPEAGSILFGGRDIARLTPRESARYRRHDVGLITQEFHLMPGAGALDNALIKLPVLGFTLREARARTLPWLQRVGLGERLDHLPEQLSMGERQRVAIARALAGEPGLLLADEPTGSLDSKRTAEILALLRDICRERSIPGLLVTHDADAVDYVDRALTLRDGRLSESPAAPTARGASREARSAGELAQRSAGETPRARIAGSRS
jgi:putative ABC transport system ATP-binding protein